MAGPFRREDLVELIHSLRHTRRGFLRGDSAPKFFPVSFDSPAVKPAPVEFRPPASPLTTASLAIAVPAPPQVTVSTPASGQVDFEPEDRSHVLTAIEASLSAPSGNAFLSWLAEQLEGKLGEDYDPFVEFGDQGILAAESAEESDTFGDDLNAVYADAEDELSLPLMPSSRGRVEPRVEISPDGWRLEIFPVGSKIVKDVLGRVVEVRSHHGDCLSFRYGDNGKIECFERLHPNGSNHSVGKRDKHGVVVRDPEGRVRASGESMSVDPRGCFYLHTFEGQFFSVDLVTGVHTERRKINDDWGGFRFVTSLFTHDGFRMATMFGASKHGIEYGASEAPRFRFYGRDGTLIEFANEDDLQRLRPERVSAPATRRLCRTWPHRRQAKTAWDAVHEYLVRVS